MKKKSSSLFHPLISIFRVCFGIFCASTHYSPITLTIRYYKIYKQISSSENPANECIIDSYGEIICSLTIEIIKPYLFYFYCSVLTLWPNSRKTNYTVNIFLPSLYLLSVLCMRLCDVCMVLFFVILFLLNAQKCEPFFGFKSFSI